MNQAKRSPNERQQEMPWYHNRGLQLEILDAVHFPAGRVAEGQRTKSVSGLAQMAVLRAIDSHSRADAWCTASHWTIGRKANFQVGDRDRPNTAHVRRTIRLLESGGYLIASAHTRRGQIRLRPNWAALIELTEWTDAKKAEVLAAFQQPNGGGPGRATEAARTADQVGGRDGPRPAPDRLSQNATPPEGRQSQNATPPKRETTPPATRLDAPNAPLRRPQGGDKSINRSINDLNDRSIDRIDEISLGEDGSLAAAEAMDRLLAVVQFADFGRDPDQWKADWTAIGKIAQLFAADQIAAADFWGLVDWARDNGPIPVRYVVGCAKRWLDPHPIADVFRRVRLIPDLQPQTAEAQP